MSIVKSICLTGAAVALFGIMTVSAQAADVGSAARGETFALEVCAECHVVSDAQEDAWELGLATFHEIANDPARNEFWLRTFLRTPHYDMPNFILTPAQVDDIVAYIESLKSW